MKKYFGIFLLCVCSLLMFSCSDDDTPDGPKPLSNDKTVVVFFPYTGNLYGYLSNNVSDIEKAMLKTTDNPNVLVYMNTSRDKAYLYSIYRKGEICVHDTLRVYDGLDNTSSDDLSSLFSEIKTLTPNTQQYNMIVGCHGMGWIFSDDYADIRMMYPAKYFDFGGGNGPITRWMGGANARIDMNTMAEGMAKASFHPFMMLFDVCYMGNIESVYELRNSTDYIIASPIEIMGKGMPYQLIWDDIIKFTPSSLDAICRKAYDDYMLSDQPYLSLSVIDCAQLENLASVVREINKTPFDPAQAQRLSVLDGYSPSIFYDLGRYVELQCNNSELYGRFLTAVNNTVLSNYHTMEYYTSLTQGKYGANTIVTDCGLTTSAPSENPLATAGWNRTSWYKATH